MIAQKDILQDLDCHGDHNSSDYSCHKCYERVDVFPVILNGYQANFDVN